MTLSHLAGHDDDDVEYRGRGVRERYDTRRRFIYMLFDDWRHIIIDIYARPMLPC